MGRGIAQIAAVAGCEVLLADANPGAATVAKDFVADMLRRAAEKGRMSAADAEAAIARIAIVDGVKDFGRCTTVVEAIVERLDVKRQVFAELEDVVAEDCILASNTSSLSVTAIAAATKRPERVAGFHFFNPVPLMKVVEVVRATLTADWVMDRLVALARAMGHRPVVTRDTP